jgi:hypothetical protein
MAPNAEKLLQEALSLPEDARVDLAEALLRRRAWARRRGRRRAAWSAEAKRRLDEVRSGAVTGSLGRPKADLRSADGPKRHWPPSRSHRGGPRGKNCYRERSQDVEERFPASVAPCHLGDPAGSATLASRRRWPPILPDSRVSIPPHLLDRRRLQPCRRDHHSKRRPGYWKARLRRE